LRDSTEYLETCSFYQKNCAEIPRASDTGTVAL